MASQQTSSLQRVISALGVSGGVAMFLIAVRLLVTRSVDFWFLPWNLFLGILPLGFAWWFSRRVAKTRLSDWRNVVLAVLWLGFLPNSFYLVTDLIHIRPRGDISILYDVVMLVSFVWVGFLAGFLSVYLMHRVALRRFKANQAHGMVALVFLLCSFAIYLGRYLRWNTWDIIFNPFSLLFDVSERFINPSDHPQAFTTTFIFFLLLTSMYWSICQLVYIIKAPRK